MLVETNQDHISEKNVVLEQVGTTRTGHTHIISTHKVWKSVLYTPFPSLIQSQEEWQEPGCLVSWGSQPQNTRTSTSFYGNLASTLHVWPSEQVHLHACLYVCFPVSLGSAAKDEMSSWKGHGSQQWETCVPSDIVGPNSHNPQLPWLWSEMMGDVVQLNYMESA